MIVLLAAMLLTTSGAPAGSSARDEMLPSRAGARHSASLGMEWRDGSGPREGSYRESFVYPNTRYAMAARHAYVEVNSPLPILIPDAIAALVWFLMGGDGIPLWTALNGDHEPAAVRFADARVRLVLPLSEFAAFEAGAVGGFYIGSVFVADERITVIPLSIGGSLAMRTQMSDQFVVRVALEGGNQSTRFVAANPWYGVAAGSTVAVSGRVAIEIRGEWRHERFDLRSYRTVDGDAIAGEDWWTLYGLEAALAYRF